MILFNQLYLLSAFLGAFLITVSLTPLTRRLALKFQIIDWPKEERKIHQKIIPLMGGLAIFVSVFLMVFLFRFLNLADFSRIPDVFLAGVFIGSILIMLGGILDDKYEFKPWQQIIWPTAATLIALLAGIKITYITNPIGGPTNAIIYLMPFWSVVLSFFWLMGMIYTTKFLDGLDGLVGGIAAIASLVIFLLSLNWDIPHSATGVWALILAGSALGFLIFNWQPAKIFLGESGSIFLGFMLGILSIISGSKITTTLLVVGLPALDVFWVIIQRLIRHESPFSHADRKHLHFRLLDLGFSQRGAVLFLYLISLIFGSLAIFNQSFGKLISLLILVILMIIITGIIFYSPNDDKNKNY